MMKINKLKKRLIMLANQSIYYTGISFTIILGTIIITIITIKMLK